jgi:hypothetical protein
LTPKVIVLAVSQNWPDLAFLEEKLVEMLGQAPSATFRLPSAPHGGGREARVFLESVGASVEVWTPDPAWDSRAPEVRNSAMLRGVEYDPQRVSKSDRDPETDWPYPRTTRPRAELVIGFTKGGNDVAGDLVKRALALAYPVVVYRPHKKHGIERATAHPRTALKLGDWKPVLREAKEAA